MIVLLASYLESIMSGVAITVIIRYVIFRFVIIVTKINSGWLIRVSLDYLLLCFSPRPFLPHFLRLSLSPLSLPMPAWPSSYLSASGASSCICAGIQPANLGVLNLSFNNLRSLPDALGGAPVLQQMYLANNNLGTLPDSFAKLPMVDLFLSENDFTTIPKAVMGMKQVSASAGGEEEKGRE